MKLATKALLIVLAMAPEIAFPSAVFSKNIAIHGTKVKCCGYMGSTAEMHRRTQDILHCCMLSGKTAT